MGDVVNITDHLDWSKVKTRHVVKVPWKLLLIWVFLPWKEVLDRDSKIWRYKEYRTVVYDLEYTGWKRLTRSEYNKLFGIE